MKTFSNLQEEFTTPIYLKHFSLQAEQTNSGKSYVVRRTTGGLGMRIVNSDEAFEKRLKDAGYSLDTEKDGRHRERSYQRCRKENHQEITTELH